MAPQSPIVVWFRQDLRLSDNPALAAAAETGAPLLPIYILDDVAAGDWSLGAASRWWLHQSLTSLSRSLDDQLQVFRGKAEQILPQLVRTVGARSVFWNRCYEPWRMVRDQQIMAGLRADGVSVTSANGSLLFEPHKNTKADGTAYRVFTPFYKKARSSSANAPGETVSRPARLEFSNHHVGDTIASLALMPSISWYTEIAEQWRPGEEGALQRLRTFLDHGIEDYVDGRDRPDQQQFVSRLSPHLHFGEISPHQIWRETDLLDQKPGNTANIEHFRRELAWREFSYNLLYHYPDLPQRNLQPKFDQFPWRDDPESLARWQRGQTGYPIVDAGMRELWRTGYMHNRVRMIVGSFLVKNLLLHWHDGEAWFWDTLVDADLANNSASWQWVAGCGADAAPYYRIFNPVTQGKKFDPDGKYVRQYIPELDRLPTKFIHNPWEAPSDVLESAMVTLGSTYPSPMVDLRSSRETALAAFSGIRASALA